MREVLISIGAGSNKFCQKVIVLGWQFVRETRISHLVDLLGTSVEFFKKVHPVINMEKYRRWTDERVGVNPFVAAKTERTSLIGRLIALVL